MLGDRTAKKVNELLQPPVEQPPSFADLTHYLAAPLPAKSPVPEILYRRLVCEYGDMADVIEPWSVSGAEALATLIGSALLSEDFESTDETTTAGELLHSCNICSVDTNRRKSDKRCCISTSAHAGQVDQLMYRIWSCVGRYDSARGVRFLRKRNCNADSTTTRALRPDLIVSYQGAMLFKGEHTTEDYHMTKALTTLHIKLKNWAGAVHGSVCVRCNTALTCIHSAAACAPDQC